MIGPGLAQGYMAYGAAPNPAPWSTDDDLVAQDIRMQMLGHRQRSLNERGTDLGRGARAAWMMRSGASNPVPAAAPSTLPVTSSSANWTAGMSPGAPGEGFAPHLGMGLREFAGKVAGPAALAWNAYQGVQGGKAFAEAAKAADEMFPEERNQVLRDVRKAAAEETAQRAAAGASAGAAFGPIGSAVGAVAGGYGSYRGGAKGVGGAAMARAVAAETGKQQALKAGAMAAGNSGLGGTAAVLEGVKRLRKLL